MIKVKLRNDRHYVPSPFNPVEGTGFECEGVLKYVIRNDLSYQYINNLIEISELNEVDLSKYPMLVVWDNSITNNVAQYKLNDLKYYKDNDNFKSIW